MANTNFNIEAEIAVLGSIFNDPNILIEVEEILSAKHFYENKHALIFDSFSRVNKNNKAIDLLTVTNDLRDAGCLEQAGGIDYLTNISTSVSIATNVYSYAMIVYEKYMIRQTIDNAKEIINYAQGNDNVEQIVDYAEQKIVELSNLTKGGDFVDWQELIKEWDNDIKSLLLNPKELSGLSTGYSLLDSYTNGFHGGEFIILAARPSMGKTAFALNLMAGMAKNPNNKNPHIAFFSLEMPAQQLLTRLVAIESGVPISKIRKADLSKQDLEAIDLANKKLEKYFFHIDETAGIKINELKSKVRKLKIEHGLDAIFIDYLQLITTNNPGIGRVQEVSVISRELKAIAKELDVPLIALSQLSREVEKRINKKPQMSDLRDSGAIEQDADIIMMLYRPDYYGDDAELEIAADYEGQTIVGIEKNRNGATGDLEFIFQSEQNIFLPTSKNY